MKFTHRAALQHLIELHLGFFEGSDFTTEESLEDSEYFRGQVELIADVLGVIEAKTILWEPLKRACAACARGEYDDDELRTLQVNNILDVCERAWDNDRSA